MLALTLHGGLGAYVCPGNFCSPTTGDTDTLFRRLQNAANAAAQKFGVGAPILVDGKIGPATVSKIYMVSAAMPPRPDLALLMTFDSQTTPGAVAANAAKFVEELEAARSGEIQMPTEQVQPIDPYPTVAVRPGTAAKPPGTTTVTIPGSQPVTTSALPAFGKLPPGARLVLGAAAIGILTIALVRYRRKRVALSGARRRRRRR